MGGLAKVSHLSPSPESSINLESVLVQAIHDSCVQAQELVGVTAAKCPSAISLDRIPSKVLAFLHGIPFETW
jgi:hypothetical protein